MAQTKSDPRSSKSNTSSNSGNQPIHSIRHRRLKAAIWQNRTEAGIFHNVTVTRSYKEGEEWRETQSFGYDDLPIVAKLLLDCHTFITQRRANDKGETEQS